MTVSFDASREIERCSRCGMCLASCPTYQDSLEEPFSPRGRVMLMKHVESGGSFKEVETYLDSCLKCGLCEEKCPTATPYATLVRRHINLYDDISDQQKQAMFKEQRVSHPQDAARARVFGYMADILDSHLLAKETEVGFDSEKKGAVALLYNPLLADISPQTVENAERWLAERGYCLYRDSRLNAIALPWLENRFQNVFTSIAEDVLRASQSLDHVFVLDPIILSSLKAATIGDIAHELLERLEVFPLYAHSGHRGSADSSTMIIDRSLLVYDEFLEKETFHDHDEIPVQFRAAGAVPILNERATMVLGKAIEQKSTWLTKNPGSLLLTVDTYCLARFSQSRHLIDHLTLDL